MPAGWAIAIVVLWVAVAGLAVVILGILRQITPVLERAAAQHGAMGPGNQGPPVGDPVPHFSARDTAGELVDEQSLRGQPALLLFLSVGCGPCEQLAAEIRRADLGVLARQLIIVTRPDGPRVLGIPEGLRVVTETSDEMTGPLAVIALPFAIAVDASGIVKGARVPNTVEHLDRMAAVLAEPLA
jgi:methylamine dehydrogenase accessory protein MauD